MKPTRRLTSATAHYLIALSLALGLAVSGCGGGSGSTPDRVRVQLGASFVQQRWHENTDRADVRVTNLGDQDIMVTGVGISWPGFPGDEVFPADATFSSGQTIDLAMTLPAPDCAADETTAVHALVEAAGRRQNLEVDGAGRRAITSIWRRECAEARLRAVADLTWGPTWRVVSHRGEPELRGTLELTRRSGTVPVGITGLRGSVLLDLEPVHDRTPMVQLSAAQDHAALPVLVGSNGRCDAHAVGGSTQTFLLRVNVQLGQAEPQQITMSPDKETQAAIMDVVRAACGVG